MSKTAKKSISEKIAELESSIEWFSSDDFSLDEALDRYRSAITLAEDIETDLNTLKNDITVLAEDFKKS